MEDSKIIEKHFWCEVCREYWKTADFLKPEEAESGTGSLPSQGRRPSGSVDDQYDFYCKCPGCGELTKAVPHYYANLKKMRTTGPRTDAGKARSAMNGVKHGMYAQPNHLLAPANGKYDICADCEAAEACQNKELRYCPFKTDLLLRFIAAYENGDLNHLKTMSGLSQGRLYLVLESCFSEIGNTGVLLKSLKVSNGDVVYEKKTVGEGPDAVVMDDTDKPIFEYKSNPLIDVLPKVMESLGMSSNQQNMNPAKKEDDDPEKLKRGQLPAEAMSNFMNTMADLLKAAGGNSVKLAELSREADRVHNDLKETGADEEPVPESAAPDSIPFK
jgi:hypothetical protein